jgi:hypothetical protein
VAPDGEGAGALSDVCVVHHGKHYDALVPARGRPRGVARSQHALRRSRAAGLCPVVSLEEAMEEAKTNGAKAPFAGGGPDRGGPDREPPAAPSSSPAQAAIVPAAATGLANPLGGGGDGAGGGSDATASSDPSAGAGCGAFVSAAAAALSRRLALALRRRPRDRRARLSVAPASPSRAEEQRQEAQEDEARRTAAAADAAARAATPRTSVRASLPQLGFEFVRCGCRGACLPEALALARGKGRGDAGRVRAAIVAEMRAFPERYESYLPKDATMGDHLALTALADTPMGAPELAAAANVLRAAVCVVMSPFERFSKRRRPRGGRARPAGRRRAAGGGPK